VLFNQGKLGEAEPLYREAMSARRRTQGDEHPDTLDSINNLALLLQTQGKRAEALEMFRQELEVRRSVLGEGHPSTLRSLRDYAELTS
jgi:tetratricopeptide (TPR) repeat protein